MIEREVSDQRAGSLRLPCVAQTEVELRYSWRTADATFDESGTVKQIVGEQLRSLGFNAQPDEVGGQLTIEPVDGNATVTLAFRLWWPDDEFSGSIGITVQTQQGSTGQGSAQPKVGSFSRSGCDVGQWLAGPGTTFAGVAFDDELRVLDEPTTFRAIWQDTGAETQLTLTPDGGQGPRCRDDRELIVSEDATLSTSDGRIAALPVRANHRLSFTFDEPKTLMDRQWSGSGEMQCDISEPWAFPELSCTETARVAFDFIHTVYVNTRSVSGGRLTLYLYGPNANPDASSDAQLELELIDGEIAPQ